MQYGRSCGRPRRPNLAFFSLINPCGIVDKGVTSISKLLGRDLSLDAVRERLLARFAEVFNVKMEEGSGDLLGIDKNN